MNIKKLTFTVTAIALISSLGCSKSEKATSQKQAKEEVVEVEVTVGEENAISFITESTNLNLETDEEIAETRRAFREHVKSILDEESESLILDRTIIDLNTEAVAMTSDIKIAQRVGEESRVSSNIITKNGRIPRAEVQLRCEVLVAMDCCDSVEEIEENLGLTGSLLSIEGAKYSKQNCMKANAYKATGTLITQYKNAARCTEKRRSRTISDCLTSFEQRHQGVFSSKSDLASIGSSSEVVDADETSQEVAN